MSNRRVGIGYDVHRLVADRSLILGGVTIPFELGLLGHSDADVLTHAICDALLGAAGLGDIGIHFPDSDERYRGISSLQLLAEVVRLVREAGHAPVNVDATVVAERPRLTPEDRIGLKATTSEGLGALGSGDGIAAMAVCLIETA